MLLQALIAYAERENLGDADFHQTPVRWLVPLDSTGNLTGDPIELLDNPDAKKPKPKTLTRPFIEQKELTVASRPSAFFLCDTLERAVNFPDPKRPERTERREGSHACFKQLLETAAGECSNDGTLASATLNFLNRPDSLERLHASLREQRAKPDNKITFRISGRMLLESEELRQFWRRRRAARRRQAAGGKRLCLATGELTAPISTTEKIQGVPGGLAVGTNLISFDKASFTSFGLRQGENASISAAAELKIRSALNDLIQRGFLQAQNKIVHIHWTREKHSSDPSDLVETAAPEDIRNLLEAPSTDELGECSLDPAPEDIRNLLEAPSSAQPQPAVTASKKYYAMSLSGNGGRITVREWLESTVPEVERNVRQWFEDLAIVRPEGDSIRCDFKLGYILYGLVRDKPAELPPQIPTQLLYAALRNAPLPLPALAAALRRQQIETDNKTNPARLALIKACLARQDRFEQPTERNNMTPKLNTESTDPAYLCGRLFSVFDRLQYLALGNVNAGVVERFYAGASTTPAMVMGRLFRNAQFHLAKTSGGVAENVRKDFEFITAELGDHFPSSLDLEGQGRFALGYYHQKAEYRRRSMERKEQAANTEHSTE